MYSFERFGWLYISSGSAGFPVTSIVMLFLVPVFMAVIRNVHAVPGVFYPLFVYTTRTACWGKWPAEKNLNTRP